MHRRRRKTWQPEAGRTIALDREGRGIVPPPEDRPARREARVEGALAGESIVLQRLAREGQVDRARVVEVLEPAPERVAARCPHYGICGGCSTMHMDPAAQLAHKQALLLADFAAHDLRPERVLEPLRGEPWAYRRRARLAAKWVEGKAKVVVGFREKDHRFVADLNTCEVLSPPGGALIPALSQLIGSLDIARRVPQIELSMGDDACALTLRVLDPPSAADLERIREFARTHEVRVFLQPGGLESLVELAASGEPVALVDAPLLHYRLPSHSLELGFRPTDFVQVNAAINRAMIDRALELLDVQPGQRVLDLFCGLGNFSLPIARRGAQVLGVEGDAGLVERARSNAERNGLAPQARFATCDLYGEFTELERLLEAEGEAITFDRVLLDPPRSGAQAVVERFARIAAPRVVYVACSPQTLARDAAILVRTHGYRLSAAGIIDMFPHTAHVESIALLER